MLLLMNFVNLIEYTVQSLKVQQFIFIHYLSIYVYTESVMAHLVGLNAFIIFFIKSIIYMYYVSEL